MDIFLILLIIGILAGGFLAWNIGANDVSNAMGTSVGSKSVTLKQAMLIAAIFEFGGAVLVGAQVTKTVGKGIIDLSFFGSQPELLALGMACALMSTGIWILIATIMGLPVSTTHSIIGAVIGFGSVSLGVTAIKWGKIGSIVLSWVVSPIMGGIIAYIMFMLIAKHILNSPKPVKSFKKISPILIFVVFMIICLATLFKGLKNLHLDLSLNQALLASIGISFLAVLISYPFIRKIKEENVVKDDKYGTKELKMEYNKVENVFKYLQVLTACCMAFAHGSNDVANSIGPLSIIVSVFKHRSVSFDSGFEVPIWILLLGGTGIVIGLATYGYKIIGTIGERITELTPSRGFSAELAAATTVLLGSKLGLPISTTHTLVGSVIGVGFARGLKGINLRVIWQIASSWVITLPFTALLCVILYVSLKFVLGLFGLL